MVVNEWSQYEKDLLLTELSDVEIADITGRTLSAVRAKRYKLIGHYVETDKQREKMGPVIIKPYMADEVKEARILALAKDMRV